MRRSAALALMCASAFGMPGPADAVSGDFAPYTARIAVKMNERLSSATSHAGDSFAFVLTGSVAVDGYYLAAGTFGHGVVVTSHPADGSKRGELELEARTVDLPDGRTLGVSLATDGRPEATVARDHNVVYEKDAAFTVLALPPP